MLKRRVAILGCPTSFEQHLLAKRAFLSPSDNKHVMVLCSHNVVPFIKVFSILNAICNSSAAEHY